MIVSEEMRTGFALTGQEVQNSIITQRCSTYICDKLSDLNMEVEFSLVMRDESGVCYPYEIELRGSVDEKKREIMSSILFEDMGIPEERQVWLCN